MSETKFTPGPWKAFFGTENNRVLIGIGEETGEGIADCGDRYWRGQFGMWRGKDEDAAANAHLIAAAPCLYSALEAAKKELEQICAEINGEDYNNLQINAALAKARGETP